MSALKKAINLANLNAEAEEKIKQFVSHSATILRREIGDTVFTAFIAMPEDSLVYGETGFVAYELLTSDQRLRRDIETAQAYFILYLAMPGLKEMELGSVMLDKISFGEGNLTPTAAGSVERYQRIFWKLAVDICTQYSDSGDIDFIVI